MPLKHGTVHRRTGGHSSHHSSYLGCLGYSSNALKKRWIFNSEPPACSYKHHGSGGSSGGGSSGGSSSGGSSGGSSSGGSSGGSSSGGSSGGSSSGGSSGGSSSGGSAGGSSSGGSSGGSSSGGSSSGSSNGGGSSSGNGTSGSSGNGGNNSNGNGNGGDENNDGYSGQGGANSNGNGNGNNGNGNNNNNNGGQNNGNSGNGSNNDEDVTNEDFENENDDAYQDDEVQDDVNGGSGDDAAGGGNNQNNNGNNQNGNGNNNNDQNGDDGNNQQYDPFEDFDIAQCDTFENLWLWDLSLTCESEMNLDSCECVFAEELLSSGYVQCDDRLQCPSGCQICTTCFQLMGCDSKNRFRSSTGFTYLILTILSLLFCGIGYYYFRVRHSNNDLSINLIADDSSSDEPRMWLAPVKFSDSDAFVCLDATKEKDHVWLAPVLPSIDITASQEVLSSEESDSSADMLLPCPVEKLEHRSGDGDNVWLAPITE